MNTRRILVGVGVTATTLLVAGYGIASVVVYNRLTKIGACPAAWASNDTDGWISALAAARHVDQALRRIELQRIDSRPDRHRSDDPAGVTVNGREYTAAAPYEHPLVLFVHIHS